MGGAFENLPFTVKRFARASLATGLRPAARSATTGGLRPPVVARFAGITNIKLFLFIPRCYSASSQFQWLGSLTVRFSALQISRQWMNDLYVEKIYSHFRFRWDTQSSSSSLDEFWNASGAYNKILAALKIPSERHTTKTKWTSFFTKFAGEIFQVVQVMGFFGPIIPDSVNF